MVILHRLRREFSALLDLLLPPACLLCGRDTGGAEDGGLCAACRSGIHPVTSPRCPRCALPYPTEGGTDHLCEACLRDDPPFANVYAAGIYEETLRLAVQRFKYQGAVELQRPLGHLLISSLAEAGDLPTDLLVPVPLHRGRLSERTYNQSLLLAAFLGRRWRIPVAGRLLLRTRSTSPQQGLTARQRKENLLGAFALRMRLKGEKVLLVDDVLTTGATARECSRALLAGGASEVAVAVLGRARRHPR